MNVYIANCEFRKRELGLGRVQALSGERDNLQIVCRFANRWKGSSDNDGFIALIEKVRAGETPSN